MSRIADFVLRRGRGVASVLSVVAIVLGVLMVLAFPFFVRATYISENALLIGMTRVDLDAADSAFFDTCTDSVVSGDLNASASASALEAALGVPFEVQGFRVAGHNGSNVYGVYRPPRGDGKEAMLLGAPWNRDTGDTTGVCVVVATLRYLQRVNWLSRDVVVVLWDASAAARGGHRVGLQAWLDAYVTPGAGPLGGASLSRVGAVWRSELGLRGGLLQTALGLEMTARGMSKAAVLQTIGANGQLSNLDLLNTVSRVMRGAGRTPILHGADGETPLFLVDWPWLRIPQLPWLRVDARYSLRLSGLLRFLWRQAWGVPSSAMGHCPRYAVDAVNVVPVPRLQATVPRRRLHSDVVAVMSTLARTMRSLSNILEHLHQSFWLYLLPNAREYISYGDYIYALVAVAVGLWLRALALFLGLGDAPGRMASVAVALQVSAVAHLAGLLVFLGAQSALAWASYESVAGAAALLLLSVVVVLMPPSTVDPRRDWDAVKMVVLTEAAIVSFCLSLLNFAFALAYAGLFVLLLAPIAPASSRLVRLCQGVWLSLGAPWVWAGVAAAVYRVDVLTLFGDQWLYEPVLAHPVFFLTYLPSVIGVTVAFLRLA